MDKADEVHTHTHTRIVQPFVKKEWNFAICSNVDELGGQYDKWNVRQR